MKHRLPAILLCLAVGLSLCACAPDTAGQDLLNGKKTEYSETIAYATGAWGGVEIAETEAGYTLKNKTAQLNFGAEAVGLKSLTSLQTGETLLQNTFETKLTTQDGKIAEIVGGTESVDNGYYGIGHRRTHASVKIPGDAGDAATLKEFDLTKNQGQSAFSALKNDLSAEQTDQGLKITSQGKSRAQFGARYLGIDLGTYDHHYLSVTVRAENISGLKCYFATEATPLTEDTSLGTLNLSQENTAEFITLTAEIRNPHWGGTLQTLLFRLPEGESGTVEISRIALLTLNDPLDEEIADTLWTVYSDRMYFSQTLNPKERSYSACSTVMSVPAAKCKEVIETENAIALKLIDGSILGVVLPATGATARVERSETALQVIFDWDLSSQTPTLALRLYLNYTDDTAELEKSAQEERTPLTAEDFILEGAEFERYDAKGGIYRLTPTGEPVSVTVKKNDRTVYLYLPPAENTAWKLYDKNGDRLPVFAGATFPVCAKDGALRVQLIPEAATQASPAPSFFAEAGLKELSRTATVLNGLCAQDTAVYTAADGSYSATVTSTRLKDGTATIYDIRYDFHARKHVSDVRNAFSLFSFELGYGFDEYFYYNEENETVRLPAGSEEISYLGAMPYLCLSAEGGSAGWLVTKNEMTVSGESATALLCLRYEEVTEGKPNRMYLSFDQEEIDFIPGDTLTAQVIRMDTQDPKESVLRSLRDGGNFRLIQTENRSEKTIFAKGMEETVILQIEGFDHYKLPEIAANGEVITPEYHVYVDEMGYYGFAFAVKSGTEITVKD